MYLYIFITYFVLMLNRDHKHFFFSLFSADTAGEAYNFL